MAGALKPFRHELEDLYVAKSLKLENIRKLMKEEHSIDVGRSSYERLFKKWRLKKNKRAEHWRWVSYEIQRRRRNGHESHLRINDEYIPDKVVQKEISRHVTTLEQAMHRSNTGPSPQRPEGYAMVTPGWECNPPPLPSASPQLSLPACRALPLIPGIVDVKFDAFSSWSTYLLKNSKAVNLVDEQMLVKTLRNCCAFITVFDSRAHIPSSKMMDFYQSTARSILIVSQSPHDYIVQARSACFMISFDILVSTYRNDIPAVRDILKSLKVSRYRECRYQKIILASLFLAVVKGSSELVNMIRDVLPGEPRDSHGHTCLSLASLYGHVHIVQGLIQSGADVDALCGNGATTLQTLTDLPLHVPVSQLLREAGARTVPILTDMNALCQAAARGQVEVVRDMLRELPDLSHRPLSGGWAPLHWAANTKIVRVLLDAGADINFVADTRETPLDVHFHDDSIRELLVANGGKTSYALTFSERARARFEPYE